MAYSLVLVLRKHNEPHWELYTRVRLSIDVSSVPLPLSLWDICSSCPLVLLSAGRSVCVLACVYALVEVGLAGRLALGVLWHLPLWKGLACTLVGHHIYQWLIVTSRSPWKHNRDLWPLLAQRLQGGHWEQKKKKKKKLAQHLMKYCSLFCFLTIFVLLQFYKKACKYDQNIFSLGTGSHACPVNSDIRAIILFSTYLVWTILQTYLLSHMAIKWLEYNKLRSLKKLYKQNTIGCIVYQGQGRWRCCTEKFFATS